MSDAASIVQALSDSGQHRSLANNRWSAAYDLLSQREREEASWLDILIPASFME
jgi:hypothetical protein